MKPLQGNSAGSGVLRIPLLPLDMRACVSPPSSCVPPPSATPAQVWLTRSRRVNLKICFNFDTYFLKCSACGGAAGLARGAEAGGSGEPPRHGCAGAMPEPCRGLPAPCQTPSLVISEEAAMWSGCSAGTQPRATTLAGGHRPHLPPATTRPPPATPGNRAAPGLQLNPGRGTAAGAQPAASAAPPAQHPGHHHRHAPPHWDAPPRLGCTPAPGCKPALPRPRLLAGTRMQSSTTGVKRHRHGSGAPPAKPGTLVQAPPPGTLIHRNAPGALPR